MQLAYYDGILPCSSPTRKKALFRSTKAYVFDSDLKGKDAEKSVTTVGTQNRDGEL